MKRAWTLLLACGVCLAASDRVPMTAKFEDSASFRWLAKKVLRSRVLDDCGSLDHWKAFTTGGIPLVDARVDLKATDAERAVSEMSITAEGSRDGGPLLRVRVPARLPVPGPKSGRAWGGAGVRRLFGGEDWRRFNRVAFWVRPEGPGFFVTALELRLYNEGLEKLPAPFGQEGETTVVLRNHEWNRVVWEIGNVARDKVASLEFHYLISGGEPEAGNAVVFDFDDLELEDTASGQRTVAESDPVTGRFRATVPEGTYVVRSLGAAESRTFLPGGAYEMDLRPGQALDFEVTKSVSAGGEVTIKLIARGNGAHRFTVRADNLTLSEAVKELSLESGREGALEWRGRIVSSSTPWIAVVYPDDDLSRRKEIN